MQSHTRPGALDTGGGATAPAGKEGPDGVASRADLAAALTALRMSAGLSVREVVTRSGGLHGTISGWFSGQHLPYTASFPMFDAVLQACGVTTASGRERWHAAVLRARQSRPRSAAPYRGLEPFAESDAQWFFGRDELVDAILDRLDGPAARGPVIVIGQSGSGKSSVLRAGVVPALRDPDRGGGRAAAVTTPRRAVEVLQGLQDDDGASEDAPPVLVVDQFEELWTSEMSEDDCAAIVEALTTADDPARGAPPVRIVMALRADFYGNAAAEPALIDALESPVVVGPMTDGQIRTIITEPAALAGATVEESLVRLLVAETRPPGSATGTRPGTLPLLSHALLMTWGRSRHKTLTVADYYASGGIGGAVEQSAETVYSALNTPQQAIAQRVFLRLVTIDGDADTALRRRATRDELTGVNGSGSPGAAVSDVDTVIGAFVERRLLIVGDGTVEVAHEVLLTAWRRLHDWIDENRAGLVVRRQLTEAAELWLASERDPETLLSGNRLALMRDWSRSSGSVQAPSPVEQEFLDACSAEEDARAAQEHHRYRIMRRLVVALAAVTVLVVTAAVIAGVARYDADRARTAAVTARNEAMARQIATQSDKLRTRDPALSAQMALASYRVAPVLEARSALLDATAMPVGARIVGPTGGMKAEPSPDGSWFATAASDGDVRLYRTELVGTDPAPIAVLDAFDRGTPPYALAIAPSGRLIAVGGEGGAQLWDVSDPAAPHRAAPLPVTEGTSVQNIVFTADGRYALAGTGDSRLLRWDTADPEHPVALEPITLPGTGRVSVAVSPDGHLVATGGTQSTMRLWDAARIAEPGPPLFEVPPDPGSTTARLALAFTPDSTTLLVGTTARTVERWSVADPHVPRPLAPLTGFTSYVNAVAVSRDGTTVAAGSSDNSIRVWNLATDALVATLPGRGVVTSTRFMPDGRHLLTAGVDGVTRLWPLPGPVLAGATDTVFTAPIDSTGTVLLVGSGSHDDAMDLWDVSDPDAARRAAELAVHGDDRFTGASAQGTAATGRRLAAAGTATGGVYLWDVSTPDAPQQMSVTRGVVDGIVAIVAFSPGADLLAVSDQSAETVHLLDVTDPAHPREAGTFDAGNYPQSIDFSPGGGTVAVATADNTVELWNVASPGSPGLRTTLTGFTTYAQAVAFSPDGNLLAAGSADETVREWDVSDIDHPREIGVLPNFGGAVYSVDYNADGTRLAAATSNGTVRVWDVHGTEPPTSAAALTAYGSRTFDARFGRDGLLAAAGPDGTVRLWSTDLDAAAAKICATRGTPLTDGEWARYLPGVPRHSLCG